jgi:methylglyoxal synthase
MPRTHRIVFLAAALLSLFVLSASAVAAPGAIDRVSQGPSGGNGPTDVQQGSVSADGRCVVFDTTEALTNDDVNTRKDIYERCDGVTKLVSIGPAPGAGNAAGWYLEYRGMSSDGGCVLFDTNYKLTADDGDSNIDIYKRCGADIQRVSQGPNGGDAAQDVYHGQLSADGVCVTFQAHEALTSDDHDTNPDIYERCGSTTKRISFGPAGGDDPQGYPQPDTLTPDGACVAFDTREKLTADDSDDSVDTYVRCGSTIRKATPGNGGFDTSFDALSPDGQCVVFETEEPLAATDTDTQNDIYRSCGASLEHVSSGPAGGGGDFSASDRGVSTDTSCVLFDTAEKITADDTDSTTDIYKRCGANVERVSTGDGGGNAEIDAEGDLLSADGRCAVFTTAEHVTSDDTDASDDIFERCDGTTERLAQGPAGGNGSFVPLGLAISPDGTRVVFSTDERLTADDTNDVTDIYERSGGQTTRVSPDQTSANPYGSNFHGASDDASHVLMERDDRLTSDDTDDRLDIYLVSIAPTAATGGATDVTSTSATLHGRSGAGTFHFEVAGTSTSEADVPAGPGVHGVSAALTGLTPGTTYHYRLAVTGAGGTTRAAERTFTTSAAPSPGGDGGSGNSGNEGGTGDGGNGGNDGSGTPPPGAFGGVSIVPGTVKVKGRLAKVKVSCPAAAQGLCRGTLTVTYKKVKVGAKSFAMPTGKSATVTVRITKAGRKLLAKKRVLRASATAVARDDRGARVTTGAKLALKRG